MKTEPLVQQTVSYAMAYVYVLLTSFTWTYKCHNDAKHCRFLFMKPWVDAKDLLSFL